VASLATLDSGCRSDNRDFFVVPFDAGDDASEAGREDAGPEIDPELGGPCTEDVQCDDLIPCTFDRCDHTVSRCRNTPDDTQCDDKEYCNGLEVCKLRQGCVRGPVVTCGDGNACTIDRCIEATRTCERLPRDSDGDGDPDDHCSPNRDCDDTDPTVSSTRAEICGNFKDDNCNGEIDETGCQVGANDVCSTAFKVTAAGTYLLDTVASQKDYTTSCSVRTPSAARDIVVEITVPAGAAQDVVVRAETSSPRDDVAIALQTTCGNAASEKSCGYVRNAGDAWAIARSVAADSKLYAVVTTQSESKVDLRVDLLPATTKPTNETCATPKPVTVDQPFEMALIDPAKDLASDCSDFAKTGELTYSFTLTQPRDVEIYASTLVGSGEPVVSLRKAACADELRCRLGNNPPAFVRSLPTGTHVFSVAATSQIRANVLVKTSPPTGAPPDQTCATAPTAQLNVPFSVNLAGHEDAIKNGCLPGGPNAAYKLTLAQRSDVLVVGSFASSDVGGVSINTPACGVGDSLECSTGSGLPLRVSRRNMDPGDYRVVVADQRALNTELLVLVRPAVAPVTVTSDTCGDAAVIPETGGFFTGNTENATANLSAGCDAPGQRIFGAKDQQLRLTLSKRQRVVFDMLGSTMSTLLDIRSGDPCPGVEVPNACAIGTGPSRSFLDKVLDAGTYWVQVDGYNDSAGPWYLDVRVLDP
jgi:hypothetical protein